MSGTKAVPGHPGVYSYSVKKGPLNKRTRYAVVVSVGKTQKWLRGFITLTKAEESADRLRVEMRSGQTGSAPARMTVREYIETRWWPYAETRLKSSESVRSYKVQVRHVKDRLGDARLSTLSITDVEGFKSRMQREGVGPSMANAAYDRLRQSLNQAVKWGLIWRSPCTFVEAPTEPKRRAPILPIEAIQRLLTAADATDHGTLVYLTAMTGLRWGEVTSLRWADVDIAEATLRLMDSKSEAGIRAVALGPTTVERLQRHRLEQMRYFTELGGPPPALVFATTIGTKMGQANFQRRVWAPLRLSVGLRAMRFHDLRHVHATLLARAGVHPSVMKDRLGHADSRITMEVYTHTNAGQQIEAAAAVEALLRP